MKKLLFIPRIFINHLILQFKFNINSVLFIFEKYNLHLNLDLLLNTSYNAI